MKVDLWRASLFAAIPLVVVGWLGACSSFDSEGTPTVGTEAGADAGQDGALPSREPDTLATEAVGKIGKIALDDTDVYWAVESTGEVKHTPKGGGSVTTIATNLAVVTDFALGPTEIFVNGYGAGPHVVSRGGLVTKLPDGCALALGVAFAEPDVYYTVDDCAGNTSNPLRLFKATRGDGGFLDAGELAVGPFSNETQGLIAVGGSNVLVTVTGGLAVTSPALTQATQVASQVGTEVFAIAIDGDAAYVRRAGQLVQMSLSNTASASILAVDESIGLVGGNHRAQLAFDATHIYFGGLSGLLRVAKQPGAKPERLVANKNVVGIAVDLTHVYFSSDDRVYRFRK